MQRRTFIERVLRQVYGVQPSDDSDITFGLVNQWLNDAIGIAAKTNYTDGMKLEGIAYVNNSFYTTFKTLAVTKDENYLWKITLPQIPFGIGRNEGISTLKFKDSDGRVSLPCIPLTAAQTSFHQTMRPVPNKTLFYSEGKYIYALSTLLLSEYTATVTMVSGGDSTDLTSELNVPDDYIPVLIDYITKMLLLEKAQPQDVTNDGVDNRGA